jgi:hypothetical protein
MLLGWNGVPVDEPFLRDTINVSYWDGVSKAYPQVKLRMDFRNANVAGTFVYHCHLLEHEDAGMMGLIRVEPAIRASPADPRFSAGDHPLCGNPAVARAIRSRSQHSVTYSAKTIHERKRGQTARAESTPRNSF